MSRALADPSRVPDICVIMVGANDVTHRMPPTRSVRHLASAVRRLRTAGAEVVVGTCPDLGTIEPVWQPLRWMARRASRQLAAAQTIGVVEQGGRTVSLGDLLGPEFAENPRELFGPDSYHPSAEGYATAAMAVLPTVCAALGLWPADEERPDAARREGFLPVARAAAEAASEAGTEVAAAMPTGPRGAWALLKRRRRRRVPEAEPEPSPSRPLARRPTGPVRPADRKHRPAAARTEAARPGSAVRTEAGTTRLRRADEGGHDPAACGRTKARPAPPRPPYPQRRVPVSRMRDAAETGQPTPAAVGTAAATSRRRVGRGGGRPSRAPAARGGHDPAVMRGQDGGRATHPGRLTRIGGHQPAAAGARRKPSRSSAGMRAARVGVGGAAGSELESDLGTRCAEGRPPSPRAGGVRRWAWDDPRHGSTTKQALRQLRSMSHRDTRDRAHTAG